MSDTGAYGTARHGSNVGVQTFAALVQEGIAGIPKAGAGPFAVLQGEYIEKAGGRDTNSGWARRHGIDAQHRAVVEGQQVLAQFQLGVLFAFV